MSESLELGKSPTTVKQKGARTWASVTVSCIRVSKNEKAGSEEKTKDAAETIW